MHKLKFAWLVPALWFLLLVTLFVSPVLTGVEASEADNIKVGVYYYPWYVGNWSINHANCINTPLLGGYDSSDYSVISQHLKWLNDTGIDFIIFSWWGKNSSSDRNTQLIVSQLVDEYPNMEFFLMVEPFGSAWPEAYDASNGTYDFGMIYSYLYDTYTSKYTSHCLFLDDRPAVGFHGDPSRSLTANGVPQDPRFSTRLIGCNVGDDWEYQVPDPSLSTQPVCRDGEISVCPRYDANGWHEDVSYAQGLYGKQWSKAISEARSGNVNIITIISWNEYAERTEIEPHLDKNATSASPYYLLDLTKAYVDFLHLKTYPMQSFVLAHEMNESQAEALSLYGLSLEADVRIDEPNSQWQTIYQLSKEYNIPLIGKLDSVTMSGQDNFTLQDWNNTVQKAVSDNKDVVKVWEIWNEPVYPLNYYGYFNGSASSYVKMLQVAYQIIKSESPESVVIGFGGLYLYSGLAPWAMLGFAFARQVVSLGGMNYCDAIGLHAYPWGNYSTQVQNEFMKSVVVYREICGKDIWVTEIGQTSGTEGRGQLEQAEFLNETFTLLKTQNVGGYVWYELNDDEGRVKAEGSFGLFDLNSKTTMAFSTYVSLTNNSTILPPPSPTPTPTPTATPNPTLTTTPSFSPSPIPTPKIIFSPTPNPTSSSTEAPTTTSPSTPNPSSQPADVTLTMLFFGTAVGLVVTTMAVLFNKLRNKK
jgi:hypothetical protein